MTITAAFHFAIPDLWIEGSLMGAKIALPGDPACQLEFPADEQEPFGIPTDAHISSIGGWRGTREHPKAQVALRLIRVTVELDSALTASEFDQADSKVVDTFHRSLHEACEAARSHVAKILSWCRVLGGQYWLQPQQIKPRLAWSTYVRDASGQRIRTGHNDPMVASINTVESALDEEDIFTALSTESAPVAGRLLADAKFYAWHASEPSIEMALMLAAVAAEVRIKTFLHEAASTEQAELVQLILDNPRDVSMAAVSLYDKALKAVTGASLREDNRELYKAVTRLFVDRNRFAHGGSASQLDSGTLTKHLKAASDAFDYLTGVVEARA